MRLGQPAWPTAVPDHRCTHPTYDPEPSAEDNQIVDVGFITACELKSYAVDPRSEPSDFGDRVKNGMPLDWDVLTIERPRVNSDKDPPLLERGDLRECTTSCCWVRTDYETDAIRRVSCPRDQDGEINKARQ
jgi:hypothetical protein